MREPGEQAILRSMGMIHEDPRADAVDAFVTAPGAPLDLGAPVGIYGIQVTRGLRHVTNDAAIEAGVALLRSID